MKNPVSIPICNFKQASRRESLCIVYCIPEALQPSTLYALSSNLDPKLLRRGSQGRLRIHRRQHNEAKAFLQQTQSVCVVCGSHLWTYAVSSAMPLSELSLWG